MTTKNSSFPFLFALLIGLIVSRVVGAIVLPTYDDAFITYRYARNLAMGQGLVYQPGEWVLGLTCPAFGLLTALFYKLGLPLVGTVVLLNIAADALTVGLTWKLLRPKFGTLPVLLFGLFFALSPIMTRICVGGMEMSLFVLLSLLAIGWYHGGKKVEATMLAAACYFLRPEAVLLLGILFVLEFVAQKKWEEPLWLMVVAAGVMVVPLILIHHYYGYLLPQSVRAKSHGVNSSFPEAARQLLAPDPFSLLMLPFAIWGVVVFMREKGLKSDSFLRTALLWGALYLAAYLAARPFIWSWYVAPISYVQFLFGAFGVADLVRRLSFVRSGNLKCAGAIAGLLPVCFWGLLLAKMKPSNIRANVYRPMEARFQSLPLHGATLLADDIGAIGYYSDAHIYDREGLVWPEAARYQTIEDVVNVRSPDYILLNANRGKMAMMQSGKMKRTYQPVARFSPTRETEMKLDPNLYPVAWKQDYILFQKRK